jgi:hypothetical protein
MHGNMIYGNEHTCVAIWFVATNKLAWQIVLLSWHDHHGNNVWSLATNKITWQMILLPRHSDRGNNVWSLVTNQIAWQIVYLPRHDGRGNNTLGNTILAWQYRLLQWRCSCQMSLLLRYRSLHVPPFATKTGVASAYISTTMNIMTTSYCHAWQRTAMVARNPNTCNAKLATVAIPYCNVTFCNHWQRTWFACNLYLLQPNWAYCNIFFCHCARVRS